LPHLPRCPAYPIGTPGNEAAEDAPFFPSVIGKTKQLATTPATADDLGRMVERLLALQATTTQSIPVDARMKTFVAGCAT